MRHTRAASGLCLAACCLLAACEPASISEARLQLARGGERVTRLTIPISQDTLAIADFLSDDTTTLNGLVAIAFDADSVSVDVGNQLQFSNIALTGFNVDVPAGVVTAGGTVTIPPTSYAVLSGEPRITSIDSIVAQGGTISITTQNRLPAVLNYTLTLKGFRNGAGVDLSQSGTVPASANDGSYASATLNFNLAGVTITPGTPVEATLSGTITIPAGTNGTYGTNAIIQDGTGSMVIQSLKGSLNPLTTPELAVSLENSQEIPSASVDFGDFENAVQSSSLNSAVIGLTLVNSSQAPVVLSNFRIGAVRLNASGQLIRDGSSNLVYETDLSNNPILVTVADAGVPTFTLGRGATKSVSVNSALLVDRIAKLAINGQRFALVTTGTATVGDGASSRIVRTDFVKVRFNITVGLDITVPVTGVLFTRSEVAPGLKIDLGDAQDFTDRIQQATMSAVVSNATPFGVVVQLVLVQDSVAPSVDLFTFPGRVTLDSVVVRAPTVDANGVVTAATSDSVTVGISGTNARVLFHDRFSVGARIRLLPGTGGNGRGAIRTTDRIIVNARAQVDVKAGG